MGTIHLKDLRQALSLVIVLALVVPHYAQGADGFGRGFMNPAAEWAIKNNCYIGNPVPAGFQSNNLPVSKNLWLSYLLPGGYAQDQNASYQAELKSAPSPADYAAWVASRNVPTINPFDKQTYNCGPETPAYMQAPSPDVIQAQLLLNAIIATFPAMYKAMQSNDYVTLWALATRTQPTLAAYSPPNLSALIETPIGFQVLGAKQFTQAQMTAFYTAAAPYWNGNIIGVNPYNPTLWGDPGKWAYDASVNFTTANDNQYPDIARFAGKQPGGGFFSKFLPIIEMVVAAVVSCFVGPEVEGFVDAQIATAEGVTAVGTLTADAVAVGTNAVLQATVSSAFGGNFTKSLVSSLEGGALTDGLGAVDGLTSTAGVLVNGTIANTVLNGGNVVKGFGSSLESLGTLAAEQNTGMTDASNSLYKAGYNAGLNNPIYTPPAGSVDFSSTSLPSIDTSAAVFNPPGLKTPSLDSTAIASNGADTSGGDNFNSSTLAAGASPGAASLGAEAITGTGTVAASNLGNVSLTDAPSDLVTVYHGSKVNGLDELLPGGGQEPGLATFQRSGYTGLNDFLDQNAGNLSAEDLASFQDRLSFESDKVGVFLDPQNAATYAGSKGTIYQVQVDPSDIYTAADRPSSALVDDGGRFAPDELFVKGNSFPVTGTSTELNPSDVTLTRYGYWSNISNNLLGLPSPGTLAAGGLVGFQIYSDYYQATNGNYGPAAADLTSLAAGGGTYALGAGAAASLAVTGVVGGILAPNTTAPSYMDQTLPSSPVTSWTDNDIAQYARTVGPVGALQMTIDQYYDSPNVHNELTLYNANMSGMIVNPMNGQLISPEDAINLGLANGITVTAQRPSAIENTWNATNSALDSAINWVGGLFSSKAQAPVPTPVVAPLAAPQNNTTASAAGGDNGRMPTPILNRNDGGRYLR